MAKFLTLETHAHEITSLHVIIHDISCKQMRHGQFVLTSLATLLYHIPLPISYQLFLESKCGVLFISLNPQLGSIQVNGLMYWLLKSISLRTHQQIWLMADFPPPSPPIIILYKWCNKPVLHQTSNYEHQNWFPINCMQTKAM